MSSESEHVNPFAAPLASDAPLPGIDAGGLSNAELIRKELINHEASIKSAGSLYLLGAVIMTVATIALLVGMASEGGAVESAQIGTAAVLTALTGIGWFLGLGIRRLSPMIRPWAIGLISLYLLISLLTINPIGLLINGYFLWLIGSDKGKRVLSPDYKDIIAATPHIKHKTSIVVWILLALVIALVLFAIVSVAVA